MERAIAGGFPESRASVTSRPAPGSVAAAWLGLAAATLAVASLVALALLILKVPGVEAFFPGSSRLFATGLALHVNLAMNVWILCCGAAAAAIVHPPRSSRLAWMAFALMLAGGAAIAASALFGAKVVMSNYVPVIDHPAFFAGCAGVASGALLAMLGLLWRAPQALGEGAAALLRAAAWTVLAALLVLGAAIATLPEGLARDASFEVMFWGYGHVMQLGFVLWMVAAWHGLADAAGGGRRTPVLAALCGYALIPAIGWIVASAPVASSEYREAFTKLMQWGSWLAPAVFFVGAALGKRIPMHGRITPGQEVFLASALLFTVGCLAGALIRGESALVPAHYHGTIGAVTLALMGWCPQMLAAAGRDLPAAALRPALRCYGIGLLALIAGLAWLGYDGLPRKAMGAALDGRGGAALVLAIAGGAVAILGALGFALRLFGALRRRASAAPIAGRKSGGTWRDARPRALALALACVVLGGAALAWFGGGTGTRLADPATHANSMRQAEVDARFKQAVVMLHAKQYEHALTALHRVLQLAPEMPEAHVNMGFALLGLQRPAAARDFFAGAIELRPAQANAYYGLAVSLDALGDRPGALGAMRTFVHLSVADDPWLPKARAALWEWQSQAKPAPG